jgi:D-beta-D-heptose 7-phosphate kinase/D-beta-D-heptose 1-phosphate adenosyltransferase
MEQKRVFTNGCFDILHVGHIKLLEFAASLGPLTVGLNSDESIRRLKGSNRPINNQSDRLEILHAIKYVTDVIIFETDTPYDLIRRLKPDIIVKGSDYSAGSVVGSDIAEVRIFPTLQGKSTSILIDKLNIQTSFEN